MEENNYTYYIQSGNGYIGRFLERNPEFNNKGFLDFVCSHNKADRDSGELQDISKHEILRLAYEWTELKWRFPNCDSRDGDWNK